MERCPSELWTHILGLACTDGGITGCAIALVSRYFRQAVLPVQLYSVALYGANRIALFADLLEQREPPHRRVRHLFISGADRHAAEWTLSTNCLNGALFRILTTVAPDLFTLANVLPQRTIDKSSVLCIPFPSLTELTLHGFILYPGTPTKSPVHDCFPSLQHLHILSSCDSMPLYTSRAPALTHLRLSAVGSMEPRLQQAAEDFVTGSANTNNESGVGAGEYSFPPTVQKVLIQMENLIGLSLRTRLSDELRNLILTNKVEKLRVFNKGRTKPRRDTRADWEDRITGGDGCWGEWDDTQWRAYRKVSSYPVVIKHLNPYLCLL